MTLDSENAATLCNLLKAILPAYAGDPTPLDWLSALLTQLREEGWPNTQEDPQAAWSALTQSESLLHGLRHALR